MELEESKIRRVGGSLGTDSGRVFDGFVLVIEIRVWVEDAVLGEESFR